MNAAQKRMVNARTSLVLTDPFWGTLSMRLVMKEDPSCATAWVDGQTLGYNPKFVENLTHTEAVALVAHETGHCALGHPWRRDLREPRKWNEACDRALNPELRKAGFQLPKGALFELNKTHEGKSAEWIFARLPTTPPTQGGQGSNSGGTGKRQQDGGGEAGEPNPLGEVRDAPKANSEEVQGSQDAQEQYPVPTEEDWRQAVAQAAVAAGKQMGKGSLGADRLVKMAEKNKVDWRSALRRFAQEVARSDYSWRRPNTRYLPSGLYLPALYSEEVGPIVVFYDTSGSVDNVLLSQFAAEQNIVMEEVRPRELYAIAVDAAVRRVQRFERGDVVKLEPAGGGGTDFRPAFEWVRKMDEPPVCVIYLTDLQGRFPDKDPGIPVLWVTGREDAEQTDVPFGEVIAAL